MKSEIAAGFFGGLTNDHTVKIPYACEERVIDTVKPRKKSWASKSRMGYPTMYEL